MSQDQLSVLRGELWRGHAGLQSADPGSAAYRRATQRVLELTANLLRAEAEDARRLRAARRRAYALGFGASLVLLGGAAGLAAGVVVGHPLWRWAGLGLLTLALVLGVAFGYARGGVGRRAARRDAVPDRERPERPERAGGGSAA
jgi:hypothetical protein